MRNCPETEGRKGTQVKGRLFEVSGDVTSLACENTA